MLPCLLRHYGLFGRQKYTSATPVLIAKNLGFDEGLREELEGLKVTAVTRRAIEAGVDVDAMADPKSALYTLVELILRADVEAGGSS